MIRLMRGFVPDDKNLDIKLRVDPNPLNDDSDYVWMSSEEYFAMPLSWKEIKDAKVKSQIDKMIPEWSRKALACNEENSYWPVKFASVIFYIPEGKFVIEPCDLMGKIDDYLFERVSNDIERSLFDMGAMYVTYTGMMD